LDIQQHRERNKQSNKSALAKGYRDLSSPLGASILAMIVLCGVFLITMEFIGDRFNISKKITNVIAIVAIVLTITILIIKVAKSTRESMKKQREAYEEKFGGIKRNVRRK
jgi:ABC-type transport system involved in cytochrome bd biosynthesis fused ATPase/permease subunit